MTSPSKDTPEPGSSENGQDKAGTGYASYFPVQGVAAISKFLSFRSTSSQPEFPPQDWDLARSEDAGTGASDWKYDPQRWQKDIIDLKDQVKEEQKRAEQEERKRQEEEKARKESEAMKEQEERQTIAQRIRTLLGSAPYPSPAATSAESKDKEPGQQEAKAPTSSSFFSTAFANDNVLKGLLYSESVMNGVALGASQGKDSVWSYLERMGPLRKSGAKGDAKTPVGNGDLAKNQPDPAKAETDVDTTEDGIMMYAPLHPDLSSHAEVADSDVLEYTDWPEEKQSSASSTALQPPSDKPQEEQNTKSSLTKRLSTLSSSFTRPGNSRKTSKTPTAAAPKREWHPSPTQISVHATWWGYRLYLPPPILAALSDAHITAAKRGAIVTAALKWLLDSVPLMLVPPTFRPAIGAIKRLSPFLGYIGAFVAWSWEKIKQQDKGNGVVLTATWLVPLALIPDAWDLESHGHPVARPVKPKKSIFKKNKQGDTDSKEGENDTKADIKQETEGQGKVKAMDEK